jgi:predicted Zn-ribbon and HTH transcriptional regulator
MMRHHEEEHGGRGTPVYADDVQEMRRALAAARAASREMSTVRQEGRVRLPMTCKKCGVLWLPRVPHPVKCPRCGKKVGCGCRACRIR